ncbi:hypothetical protein INT47_006727 [Mucor saturninus]|uniref:Uncharacterized protein n=1 Tax=Mucor saturninus TaxID=64648 RepID=A0A8H7QP89_9FUNG|nr:hypothetical protein INT47_006727 [Mucor saturninus]
MEHAAFPRVKPFRLKGVISSLNIHRLTQFVVGKGIHKSDHITHVLTYAGSLKHITLEERENFRAKLVRKFMSMKRNCVFFVLAKAYNGFTIIVEDAGNQRFAVGLESSNQERAKITDGMERKVQAFKNAEYAIYVANTNNVVIMKNELYDLITCHATPLLSIKNYVELASVNRAKFNIQESNNLINQISVHSRVLKDGFHLMDMIKLNKSYNMHKEFMRRFQDILYVCNQDDKVLVETYLSSIGTDWNIRMLINSAWIFERIRRFVPPPAELHSALKFLFDSYGPLRCANSSHRLFNEAVIEMFLHVLSTVQHPCIRRRRRSPAGTSSVEGTCHMNIVRRFASYNASVRLTDSILADYRLYHNINVGSVNRYGKKHQGHYSPWFVLAINVLRIEVVHATVQDYMCERYECYINFDQTRETYGVVEIPHNLANEIGITPATTH